MTAAADAAAHAQLAAAEAELSNLEGRKKQYDRELIALESQIYRLETSYLHDTAALGNLLRGFEGYIHKSGGGGSQGSGRHGSWSGAAIGDADRIFSRSSVTYEKALEHYERDETIRQSFPQYATDTETLAPAINAGSVYGSAVRGHLSSSSLASDDAKATRVYGSASSLRGSQKAHKRKVKSRKATVLVSSGGDDDDSDAATVSSSSTTGPRRKKKKRNRRATVDSVVLDD